MARDLNVDKLKVYIRDDNVSMGKEAAGQAATVIRSILAAKGEANIVFASSPSQDTLLNTLAAERDIDWGKVNAFHMDEYIGLGQDQPQTFSNFLMRGFFSKVKFKQIFLMDGLNLDPLDECRRYADLLAKYPTDISFLGIGENGHLGFNDPHIADFFDPGVVIVNPDMDQTCREQQVADGWFERIEDVPKSAITVSMYGLLKPENVFVSVPGKRKAAIVKRTLEGAIGTECPATGLRIHRNAKLFLDADSSMLLNL